MAYYVNQNGTPKKVLSVVKAEPCLNLNEGGSVENHTLVVDDLGGDEVIATFNNIGYHHCVSSDETDTIGINYAMILPSKEIVFWDEANVFPNITKTNDIVYFHNSPTHTHIISYDSTGALNLDDTTYVTNAYLVKDGSVWILFYNLA